MPWYVARYPRVEAMPFTGDNAGAVAAWCGGTAATDVLLDGTPRPVVYLNTPWGVRRAEPSDVVVRDEAHGTFMPWAADAFARHFEEET